MIFIGFILIWHFLTKKFINPYTLNMYIGKKGSGKSTILSAHAYEALKKDISVYSSEDIKFNIYNKASDQVETLQTIVIDPIHIYDYSFPAGSLVLIDEVNTFWDNRQFKSMDPKTVMWFRYQRHYHVKVELYSQSFDIDLKLRNLVDNFYVCSKIARIFVFANHLVKKPVVVHPVGDAPSSIQDDFIEDPKLLKLLFGSKIYYIPKWIKYFDSFKIPDKLTAQE